MIPKNSVLLTIILLVTATIFIQPCYAYRSIEFNGVERHDVIREDTLREEAKFGDYEIKIYRDWEIGTFGTVQIFKDGEIVFSSPVRSSRLVLCQHVSPTTGGHLVPSALARLGTPPAPRGTGILRRESPAIP